MKKSVIFKGDRLYYLNQTKLPHREIYKECRNLKGGYYAIKKLEVRGAPLIGVFAAYCIYVSLKSFKGTNREFLFSLNKSANYLNSSRPTAVNLSWALERIKTAVRNNEHKPLNTLKKIVLREARRIHKEDIYLCAGIAKEGIRLVRKGDKILTHCNTGFLATSGNGTALSIIYAAAKRYKDIKVYVDETRPLLQGARITAWELKESGINASVIVDGAAAYLMQKKMIDKIFVGADRIVSCGDTANKIGTYNLAVAARYHKIPFYIVAPFTTFDFSMARGEDIPVEQRNPDEVRKILGKIWAAPKDIEAYNPAFDITPARLISAIVTDRGIIYPPFRKNINRMKNL